METINLESFKKETWIYDGMEISNDQKDLIALFIESIVDEKKAAR